MKTFLRSNITALLVLLLYHAESQEGVLNFEHITGVKGVALGKITCITQDKFGYMWFADQSNQSIVRFDGYRMKVFRHVVGDSNSITLGGVEAIATDIKGNVWIGNQNGVDKLIPSENKVKHYYFPTGKRSGYVLTILVDHLGTVWIGTGDGLYSFEEKTGKFSHYTNKPDDTTSLSCNLVYTVYEDHQGVLWIGTGWPYGKYILDVPGGGLNRFNRQTRTFTQYKHNPNDPKSLINDKVRAIFEDSRGNFWVGTQGDGLHIMNRQSGTFERFVYDRAHPEKLSRPPSNGTFDHIPFITEDGAGEIWIGTYLQGLVKYDPVTKKVTHFKFDIKTNGFSDSTSWCAFKSRDGALWISTEQKNLFRVDPLAGKFSYTHLNAYSWNFLEDPPKILWVGKYNSGLSKVDRRIPGKMAIYNYFVNAENSIGVNAMCRADSGIYWVATFSGLYQFDVKRQRFLEPSITDKKRGKALKAIALFNDHANNELYITGIGLHVLNTKTNTLTEYWHDTKDTTSISADTLVFNVPDRTGNIWIGTKSQGINYFDRSKRTFTRFLPDLTTFCAYIDSHQTVWAGTDLGIYRKEEKSDSFSLFVPAATDMTFTPITALTGDDQGNIWAAASPGIFRINTESDEYCIYGRKFGITGINMLTKTDAMRTSDGKILIGAEDGYYSFDPKEVVNSVKPNILLTGFKIDGRSLTLDSNGILNRPIEEMRQIKLGHKQNIFSIDFAAIHFSDPEGNVHRYMLEGYENTWREAGAEKTAYYFNIPPGNYMFHIKAVSSYGATATKSIEIIIFPPWWRTWWAYCLYGVIAIVTVWAFIRWRTAQLKKENILLEEKVVQRTKELVATQSQLIAEKEAKLFADFNRKFSESELKALRAQMNPHFVFNILNTIESYALDNNKEAASLMIQKFSRLTRMVLENSMNQLVPIKNDLKALQLYIELEQMRYADKFLVKYNIDANMLDEDYMIPPMIIQPFVENAILHGLRNRPNNNGILNVSATVQDGYIIISVEDNGVGRAKSATLKINNPIQKKSLGINVTQDRISIFNNLNQSRKAKVEIQDLKEGTRVIIQLPIHA